MPHQRSPLPPPASRTEEGPVSEKHVTTSSVRRGPPSSDQWNTAATQPELLAVRPHEPPPPRELPTVAHERHAHPGSARESSSAPGRLSWADPIEDPITEQTGRATELDLERMQLSPKDRSLLLRMDGVHAGYVTSLTQEELTLGRSPGNDVVLDDVGVSRKHARIVFRDGAHWLYDLKSQNGLSVQGERVTHKVLRDGDFIQLGPRVGFRYTLTDAKEEKLLRRLYESSNRDALTGAYNRKHFDECLLSEVAYSVRHKTQTGLILLDIDHFKRVNDTFGHSGGDAVLRQIAGIIQSRLRAEDVFARIGGEEFAILLRSVDLNGCARLAERLRTSISTSPIVFDGKNIGVSVSLGCATLDCTRSHLGTELVRLADERLYRAKNGGRNRTVAS